MGSVRSTIWWKISKYPTQLAKMSFDEILDLTADVFSLYKITRLACRLAAGQLLTLTALIAQLTRQRPKHFDVGLPGCARNQAVVVQAWCIYYSNNNKSWNNNSKFSRVQTNRRLPCIWSLMRRNLLQFIVASCLWYEPTLAVQLRLKFHTWYIRDIDTAA